MRRAGNWNILEVSPAGTGSQKTDLFLPPPVSPHIIFFLCHESLDAEQSKSSCLMTRLSKDVSHSSLCMLVQHRGVRVRVSVLLCQHINIINLPFTYK